MAEPVWVDRLVVDAVHAQQLREHGGLHGVRDENALESALARPRNKWAYDPESDLATLAAAHGYGLATNHPYRDGNKRIAFLTMVIFLGLNGRDLEAPGGGGGLWGGARGAPPLHRERAPPRGKTPHGPPAVTQSARPASSP